MWLLATVLLVAGGALNLSQRAFHKLPPTDGVLWTQRDGGVFAERVAPGLAGSRAGIAVGDRLIGIGFDDDSIEEITSVAAVQMWLESAGAQGSLTYSYQRPSYSFPNNFYFRALRIDGRWRKICQADKQADCDGGQCS